MDKKNFRKEAIRVNPCPSVDKKASAGSHPCKSVDKLKASVRKLILSLSPLDLKSESLKINQAVINDFNLFMNMEKLIAQNICVLYNISASLIIHSQAHTQSAKD